MKIGPAKIPPQITRLILLTLAIVGLYLTARSFLIPSSFGEYGWYRGQALDEISARQPKFAGKKACDECHSDVFQKLAKFEHQSISCESCHGPSRSHAENPDAAGTANKGKLADADCIQCHQANVGRPVFLKQITLATHYAGSSCKECHVPHQPSETP